MNDAARLASAPRQRLAPLLSIELQSVLAAKLFEEPRFHDRLMLLASKRLGNLPELDTGVQSLLRMGSDDLLAFTHRVGAVWHGPALARIIDGDSRRRLADRFGADTLRTAIEAREAAPPETRPVVDAALLAERIPPVGAAVFAAWCTLQPQAVALRLDLLRPEGEPDTLHLAYGPALVARLLASS